MLALLSLGLLFAVVHAQSINYPNITVFPSKPTSSNSIGIGGGWLCDYSPASFAGCSWVDVGKLGCRLKGNAVPLPACMSVSRSHVLNLSSLLCPANGLPGFLPNCVKVAAGNGFSGLISPAKLTSGPLPASVKILDDSLVGTTISTAKLTAGALPSTVVVRDVNLESGFLNPSKLSSGPLRADVGVTQDHLDTAVDNGITADRFRAGDLPPNISIPQSNLDVGNISPAVLAAGYLNKKISVGNANVGLRSVTVDRLTCSPSSGAVSPQDLTACISLDPANLVCPAGAGQGSVPLPTCVTIQGSQVKGAIQAGQVSGLLTRASISAANVKCQTGDSNVPVGRCVSVDASRQLVCPAGAAPVALTCLKLGASQVSGTLSRALVSGSQIVGQIGPGSQVAFDGKRINDRTLPGSALRNVKVYSKTFTVTNAQLYYVGFCCPLGMLPLSCNTPVSANIADNGNLFQSVTGTYVGPDITQPESTGQMCCHYQNIQGNTQAATTVLLQMTCLQIQVNTLGSATLNPYTPTRR